MHGQTIRPEGDVGSRAVGVAAGDTGAERIDLGVERAVAGEFAGIDARFPGCGIAVGASKLAGLLRPAIDLAILKRPNDVLREAMSGGCARFL